MSAKQTEPNGVTITCGDPRASAVVGPRLHIIVLDYAPDAGIFGAGWLADAPQSIAAITLDEEKGRAVELLRDTEIALSPDLADAFGVPPEADASRAFIFFLPGRPRQWAGGLRLEVRRTGGVVEHCFALATGHFSEIGRIIELAPPDQALRLAERLLARWDGAGGDTLPPALEAWMARLHERIGRQSGGKGGIDVVVRVGTSGILLRGRLPPGVREEAAAIRLVSFGGRQVALETPLPALDQDCGFAVFAAVPGLRPDERFWLLEARAAGGRVERIPFLCPAPPPPLRGVEAALALLEPPPSEPERMLERVVSPAVDDFWRAARQHAAVATPVAYGAAAGTPQVSVIVALDRRIERMRHQIAQFSNDPEFRAGTTVELIYVVDDISVTEELRRLAQSLHGIYGVPFRTILLDRSAGPAGAGNAGVNAASGGMLLFLGADVLPNRSRWVGQLSHLYRALDRCGVLGCRLLFEDDSIRHSGITFRSAWSLPGLWEEHDAAVGLPRDLEPGRRAVPVPAVTGACLMIDRVLFHQLGGFSEEYVFGEFADSDLCLAAHQRGRRVYCTPEVELYQLAAAAPAGTRRWQEQLTRYNRWKHSRKWRNLIPTVLAGLEA